MILGSKPLPSSPAAIFAINTGSSAKRPDIFWELLGLEGFGPGIGGSSYSSPNCKEYLLAGRLGSLGSACSRGAATSTVESAIDEAAIPTPAPETAAVIAPQPFFLPVRDLGVFPGVIILVPE
ncbi:hypothetical protein ANO14919_124510 [Xylariales sp. No.14919]|nr:hypothetical protein ANO14919_124510 [Xylariales sp. No.14919]